MLELLLTCNDMHFAGPIVCRHDLTETTRAMAKRGSDDLKKLAALQSTLVSLPVLQHFFYGCFE